MNRKLKKLFRDCSSENITHLKSNLHRYIKPLTKSDFQDIYELILELQVQECLDDHLNFFLNDKKWFYVKSILDLGCGPGHLIGMLNYFFPDKKYTGVDFNKNFIRTAKKLSASHKNSKFFCEDVYKFNQDSYDYIISRALTQHLPNLERFLMQVSTLLKPGGRFVVFETNDFLELEYPKISLLIKIRSQLEKIQKDMGGNRNAAFELEKIAPKVGFEIEKIEDYVKTFILPDDKWFYIRIQLVTCATINKAFNINFDLYDLAKKLLKWQKVKNSYAQRGMRRLVFTKPL